MSLKKILIPLASLFIILLLLEIFISRFFPQKTYTLAFKDNNNCYRESPFAAFELKPNCLMKFRNFDTNEVFETKINSLGLRGDEFDPTKRQGEKRILLSGDSFILGFGVKDSELVSTQLFEILKASNSSSLNNAKVINAGYAGGFGPDGYFLYLKNKGDRLQPNLVVFSIFVYNDFSDIENSEWIGMSELGEPERIVSKTVKVDDQGYLLPLTTPLIYQLPYLRESHLAILLSNAIRQIPPRLQYVYDKIRFKIKPPTMPTNEASDSNFLGAHTGSCLYSLRCHRKTMHLFSDLLTVVKASKIYSNREYIDGRPHFVVLLIPADFQIYKDSIIKYKDDAGIPYDAATISDPNPQKRLKQMFDEEKIPYIDLLPAFRSINQKAYFDTDGHWNALGHKIAAEELSKWIMTNYK